MLTFTHLSTLTVFLGCGGSVRGGNAAMLLLVKLEMLDTLLKTGITGPASGVSRVAWTTLVTGWLGCGIIGQPCGGFSRLGSDTLLGFSFWWVQIWLGWFTLALTSGGKSCWESCSTLVPTC